MKFGVCAPFERMEWIHELGFDYMEARLKDVAGMCDEELEQIQKRLAGLGMRAETFNLFCPSELRLSCNVDEDSLRAYAKVAFSKAERLGGEIAVVGSGKARAILEGFSLEAAKDRFARALELIADVAKEHHMKIVIEPLNRKETDLVNTLADAAEMCARIGRPDIGALVDLYHFYRNGEDITDIQTYGEYILHTHIARRNDDRGAPCLENGAEGAKEFLAALERIGYRGRISLESSSKFDFAESTTKYATLLRHLGYLKQA